VTHLIVLLLRYKAQCQQHLEKEASRSSDAALTPAPAPVREVVPTEDRTMEISSGSLENWLSELGSFGSGSSLSREFQLTGLVARDKDKGDGGCYATTSSYQQATSALLSLSSMPPPRSVVVVSDHP
jgi:hypothetical protein